jgi:hypothetical protein
MPSYLAECVEIRVIFGLFQVFMLHVEHLLRSGELDW